MTLMPALRPETSSQSSGRTISESLVAQTVVCLKTLTYTHTHTHTYHRPDEFRLKWVDDTHALGIFASSKQGPLPSYDGLCCQW